MCTFVEVLWVLKFSCAIAQRFSLLCVTSESRVSADLVHVEFVVDLVTEEHGLLRVLWLFAVIIIPRLLDTQEFIYSASTLCNLTK